MTTIHGDYVGKTLIFSPYIAHIFSVPHKETSTALSLAVHIAPTFNQRLIALLYITLLSVKCVNNKLRTYDF